MMSRRSRMSRVLLVQGIGFLFISVGMLLSISAEISWSIVASDVLYFLSIPIIFFGSVMVFSSMVFHIRIGAEWGTRKASMLGLAGAMIVLMASLYLWFWLMVIRGAVTPLIEVIVMLLSGMLILSLGLPLIKLRGTMFVLISFICSLIFMILGFSFDSEILLLLSILLSSMFLSLGSFFSRRIFGSGGP